MLEMGPKTVNFLGKKHSECFSMSSLHFSLFLDQNDVKFATTIARLLLKAWKLMKNYSRKTGRNEKDWLLNQFLCKLIGKTPCIYNCNCLS